MEKKPKRPGASRPKDDGKLRSTRQIGMLTTIPALLAISPMIGYFMGKWLDSKLGWSPVLTLVFLGFGFAAGIRETIRVVRKASHHDGED